MYGPCEAGGCAVYGGTKEVCALARLGATDPPGDCARTAAAPTDRAAWLGSSMVGEMPIFVCTSNKLPCILW